MRGGRVPQEHQTEPVANRSGGEHLWPPTPRPRRARGPRLWPLRARGGGGKFSAGRRVSVPGPPRRGGRRHPSRSWWPRTGAGVCGWGRRRGCGWGQKSGWGGGGGRACRWRGPLQPTADLVPLPPGALQQSCQTAGAPRGRAWGHPAPPRQPTTTGGPLSVFDRRGGGGGGRDRGTPPLSARSRCRCRRGRRQVNRPNRADQGSTNREGVW